VTTGDLITVTSAGGQIEVPVEVTGAIMPGVVSMPHGWGNGALNGIPVTVTSVTT
jgi:anaerobic selenocysteine-containing dehydrogenase